MSENKVKNKILNLVKELNYHSKKYYIDDDPEISDSKYDSLLKELILLEEKYPQFKVPDSPTIRIGSKPLSKFESVKHFIPMMSLSNALNEEEFLDFHSRVVKNLKTSEIKYSIEPKLDGIAVSLIYEDSVFLRAATRGDGYIGENITENVKTIKTLPLKLSKHVKGIFEARGEVIIPRKEFEELNLERGKKGETFFANSRNAAGGSLRQLDSKITASRPLEIYVYGVGKTDILYGSFEEMFLDLKEMGFRINELNKYNLSPEEVIKVYRNYLEIRDSLSCEIDGAVVKVEDFKFHQILGATSKAPRWAIAIKFPGREETTKILDITVQVGRTGVLTPVAELEPVKISGALIKRATLHNMDEIERKDIRIGDSVFVQRSGDVIPKIIKVVKSKRVGKELKFEMPAKCPSCGEQIIKDEEQAAHRCVNLSCPAQLKEKIRHFTSKSGFDIDGFGEKTVEQLVSKGLVKEFSDIFKLSKDEVSALERMGDKSASNLIDSINNSKTTTLDVFIYSLGIKNVGKHMSEVLASKFETFDDFLSAEETKLLSIEGIGPEAAKEIKSFFGNETNKKIISNLFNCGIKIENLTFQQPSKQTKITDKTFVITGKMEGYTRTELEKLIKDMGGKVSNSISKNTDYLIAGEKAGSKIDRAESLGVKIIDLNYLEKKLLGNN
ncbi:MAG: NAD-dependent DNA ligase LigA [Desulforegulaceae bacterium]|nr:NAD-dependent DNA ligase LigA [Desulforegulaceae bacterium]